jgi:sugar transferase (PEP-CTERM system associated)
MLLQLVTELLCLVALTLLMIHSVEHLSQPVDAVLVAAFAFAILIMLLNVAFGLYRRAESAFSSTYVIRLVLAPAIGIPAAYFVAKLLPGLRPLEDNISVAVIVAFGGLLLVRHVIVLPVVNKLAPHRILVLGTGTEARLVEASLATVQQPSTTLVGFYQVKNTQDTVVSANRVIAHSSSLEATVRQLGINEIIVAVRQQRGGVLPLRALLDCRLSGVQVTNLARFFERVHGQVPIESLKVSWLIYGEGYRQSWVRTTVKRLFDLVVSTTLLIVSLPIALLAALMIWIEGGAPIIYRQERVGLHGIPFTVFKFRTMVHTAEADGKPAWASVGDARITRVGRLLRRTRIDEWPQLINVLRGEMSFVGPRPERPEFVAMLTTHIPFYAVRHSVKPGLTGWAQVRYSYGATVEQSVRKLEYDLYYVKNHTLVLDLVVLLETVRVVLLGEGAR